MTTPMITAARLLSHKSVNGKYITNMAMDKAPVLGSQMTHSLDSYVFSRRSLVRSLISRFPVSSPIPPTPLPL